MKREETSQQIKTRYGCLEKCIKVDNEDVSRYKDKK